ncbi:hypothetical protein GCM10025868_33770 [Angustibacter aerolatus]|uniref:Uncharacterized protein n=1 Tax=Angustibacter aerolatus TaxID=1162965 RepID=A0ABQ6JMQ6_9ACTN|nr:hypothetical protein GCM10025868_33770 [Angustibacter aerolatus]
MIGVGTRWSDFTTASLTAFAHPGVRFANVNVAGADAVKLSGLAVVADAREALTGLTAALDGWKVDPAHRSRAERLAREWDAVVTRCYDAGADPESAPTQAQVIGAVEAASGPRDVVLCAAGSMPGDLHSCGGPATRRGTTSSTASPAWATRSPAGSARGWPPRTARSSSWSATGRT